MPWAGGSPIRLLVGETAGVAGGVRFLRSTKGYRIAYRTQGSGPPLLVVPPWTTHLEAEAALSGYRAFHEALGRHHTVVLYDRWGTGLSDRDRTDFSLAADVEVLADVAEHLRLRRFALLGPSHGGLVAAAFARGAPGMVSHLVLYGTRASALTRGETWAALRELILANWPVAARAIAAVACRGAEPGDIDVFAEVLQASGTPEMTVAFQDAAGRTDVSGLFAGIRVPTVVLHRRGDSLVSVEDATAIAGRIPGARLEILDGEAHVYCVGDVASLAERITAFTAGGHGSASAQLSAREAEVLELVAGGCTNAEAAERLVLSVRTVERHLLNAYTKMGVRGRSEAIARWLSRGSGGRPSA
jgi:pimeloyl-ACP methyl ester carboxylesterase